MLLRGLNYNSVHAYRLFDLVKRGNRRTLRYNIACKYLTNKEDVLDVCAGTGEFKKFLPSGCTYSAIEVNTFFTSVIEKKCITCTIMDLHKGIGDFRQKVDAAVMIISLYQFRNSLVDLLLEDLKRIARKVIIIEEISPKGTAVRSFINLTMNYMCATDFYRPTELLTKTEFESLMLDHGYKHVQYDKKYAIGLYERANEK